jgi:hypothetical protein
VANKASYQQKKTGGAQHRVKNSGIAATITLTANMPDNTMLLAVPMDINMIPQLRSQANTYQSWRMNKVIITATCQVPNTSSGGIAMGFISDPETGIPANQDGLQKLMATQGSTQVNVWGKHTFVITPNMCVNGGARFVDLKDPSRWNSYGTFYAMVNGPTNQPGTLTFHLYFDISFYNKTIIGDQIPANAFQGMFVATFNGSKQLRSVNENYLESSDGTPGSIVGTPWTGYVQKGTYTLKAPKAVPVQVGDNLWKVIWGLQIDTSKPMSPVVVLQAPGKEIEENFKDDQPIAQGGEIWPVVQFVSAVSSTFLENQTLPSSSSMTSQEITQTSLEERLNNLTLALNGLLSRSSSSTSEV